LRRSAGPLPAARLTIACLSRQARLRRCGRGAPRKRRKNDGNAGRRNRVEKMFYLHIVFHNNYSKLL
jgi:hypothetical protein